MTSSDVQLPDSVRLLVSVSSGGSGTAALDQLRSRVAIRELALQPLNVWEKAAIVRTTLAKYRKRLDEDSFHNQAWSNLKEGKERTDMFRLIGMVSASFLVCMSSDAYVDVQARFSAAAVPAGRVRRNPCLGQL